MACRKNSPGNPCCCAVTPEMIETITFNSVDKNPTQWNADSIANCCPYVEWTVPKYDGYVGQLIFQTENYSTVDCNYGSTGYYYCITAWLVSIRFYFSKFSCESDWWVAMVAEIAVGQTRSSTSGNCAYPVSGGVVRLYREKFVPSISPGTTISFTNTDHYDWTASGACHERGSCPDVYNGEVTTTSYYCCPSILDPNCGSDFFQANPTNVDFTASSFSFMIT
jgi:hypothetical protein